MAKITYTFVLDGSGGKSRRVTGRAMLDRLARKGTLATTGWSYTVRGTQAELEALGAYRNHYGQWVYASPDKYFLDCFVWLAPKGVVMATVDFTWWSVKGEGPIDEVIVGRVEGYPTSGCLVRLVLGETRILGPTVEYDVQTPYDYDYDKYYYRVDPTQIYYVETASTGGPLYYQYLAFDADGHLVRIDTDVEATELLAKRAGRDLGKEIDEAICSKFNYKSGWVMSQHMSIWPTRTMPKLNVDDSSEKQCNGKKKGKTGKKKESIGVQR